MKRLLSWLAAALILIPSAAQARLDSAERKIVRTVDAERPRTVALLERLVNQNSGSLNLAGVEAVGRAMRAELEPLGFDIRWVPMAAAGRAGHLVAVHRGNGRGTKMLLIGHLDTVFEPDSPFQLFRLKDAATAEGPGVGDDKGGMAVMVAALRAMHAAGTLKQANIEIVLTGDEEDVGLPVEIARRDLVAAASRADVALDFEGLAREDDGRDMGSIARRGAASWTVTTRGRTGHSSGIFSETAGNGAIYELARILAAFRAELPEPNLTFNVGLAVGGATAELDRDRIRGTATGKANIIPPVAIARGDLRALSLDQQQRVMAKMRAIVARHLPGTDAEIAFDDDAYPPMAPTAANRALLARLNAVNRDLGLAAMGELDPLKRGAGDIGFVAHLLPGLVGLGAAGRGSHAPGETIDLASLPRQAKRAAILMTRLARERR
ncbi:MAG TPA: M20/M25/M40 family metallo-hydrolase [Allosphingosinicella sp.]